MLYARLSLERLEHIKQNIFALLEVKECQENRRESCPVAETQRIRRWRTHPLFPHRHTI